MSYQDYEAFLTSQNILIKARNFLVFQGDVESIAAKTPKDLTRLIEQISGSLEFKDEYDKLKSEQEKAVEQSTLAFNKKKGINAEIKQVREQKEEVALFEKLLNDKLNLITDFSLFKLFHIENEINDLLKVNEQKMNDSEELQNSTKELEKEIETRKVGQGKIQKEHMALEKKIKKCFYDIDAKNPEILKIEESLKFTKEKVSSLSSSKDKLIEEKKELVKMFFNNRKKLSMDLKKNQSNLRNRLVHLSKKKPKTLNKILVPRLLQNIMRCNNATFIF